MNMIKRLVLIIAIVATGPQAYAQFNESGISAGFFDSSNEKDINFSEFHLPPLSVLLENAKSSPTILSLEKARQIAQAEVAKQRRHIFSYLKAHASYSYGKTDMWGNNSSNTSPMIYQFQGSTQNYWNVGASLSLPLEDILDHPYDLWQMVSSKCKPVVLFKEYLEKGYYPFLLEGEGEYYTKIEQVVNYIIETELPQICKVDVANVRKIQALVSLICSEPPFELNANKIAGALEIGRDTVVEYLKYLGDAKILNLLYSDKKKVGKLTKPDKIYMENPNLLYTLTPTKVDIGTAREAFAINALSESHTVEYGKAQGDFKVDYKYTFEVGGRSKDFSQIAGLQDSYIFADDWDMPDGAKLPLWMLGFLY